MGKEKAALPSGENTSWFAGFVILFFWTEPARIVSIGAICLIGRVK